MQMEVQYSSARSAASACLLLHGISASACFKHFAMHFFVISDFMKNRGYSSVYRIVLVSAIVASAFQMSGCVGFRANNLATVKPEQLQFSSENKPKVFSRWKIESNSSLLNDQAKAAAAAIHKKQFEKALTETNCCILVEGPTEANVVVSGTAYADNNPAAMIPAFITGFSLYTIPSWVTAKVHISADVKAGEKTSSYELSDSMTMVQWLPMIFAMPFLDNPIKAGKEIDENTHKSLILKMKEGGLI